MGSQCPKPGLKTIIVWGDSHARAVAPGFSAWARQAGWAYALYAQPGCAPLPGIERLNAEKRPGWLSCTPFVQQALEYILGNPDVKVVVLAARWAKQSGTYPDIPSGLTYLRPEGNHQEPNLALSQQTFADAITTLARQLTAAGKTVIVIGPVPELPLDPQRCLANENTLALRRWFAVSCDVDAKRVAGATVFLTGALRDLARNVPNTCLVEPAALLCDEATCKAHRDKLVYYLDANHLSASGAQAVIAQAQPIPCLERAARMQ
jgi:hypothetical protein